MEKFCSFFCSVDKYGPLILLSVQYMVEPFCLTNFSATSHSTHPVPAVPSQAGRKSEPFLSFFISICIQKARVNLRMRPKSFVRWCRRRLPLLVAWISLYSP